MFTQTWRAAQGDSGSEHSSTSTQPPSGAQRYPRPQQDGSLQGGALEQARPSPTKPSLQTQEGARPSPGSWQAASSWHESQLETRVPVTTARRGGFMHLLLSTRSQSHSGIKGTFSLKLCESADT